MASSRDHRCCDNSLLTVTAAERCAEWIFRLIGHSASLAQLRGLAHSPLESHNSYNWLANCLPGHSHCTPFNNGHTSLLPDVNASDWAGHVYLVNVADLQAMTPRNIVECSHDTYIWWSRPVMSERSATWGRDRGSTTRHWTSLSHWCLVQTRTDTPSCHSLWEADSHWPRGSRLQILCAVHIRCASLIMEQQRDGGLKLL